VLEERALYSEVSDLSTLFRGSPRGSRRQPKNRKYPNFLAPDFVRLCVYIRLDTYMLVG